VFLLTRIRTLPLALQFLAALGTVVLTAWGCWLAQTVISYRITALVLLMAVSVLAMVFRMGPVTTAAMVSALIWNFFFIPPTFTFHIGGTEDALMFLLYFVVATVNAVLGIRIREAERSARDKEEKEKALALYNTLFNSLSHELRTPIAAIIGATDTLRNEQTALTTAQRTELLATVEEAGARLDRQVGNLLHMGRLEGGMLIPKADWCDVNELIGRVLHGQTGSEQHRLLFHPDQELPLFKLDSGLLEQVLHNLLHNALGHTPAGTTITVEAHDQQRACVLVVRDDGPGMADEDRARAFDKFHRGAGVRTGGTGLGLSIVKGFTEAMGGTVNVEPVTPRGLCFTVRIPAETSHLDQLNHD
jgi:two-component system, OmpR family, sensor histidine kinase KdpD